MTMGKRRQLVFRFFTFSCVLSTLLLMCCNLPIAVSLELPVHNVDTGVHYATIQDAIDAEETLHGHTLLVAAGTYVENVVVHKQLRLIGEGPDATRITAATLGKDAIHVTAHNVQVRGFTIANATQWYPAGCGVYIDQVNNLTLSNNYITNNTYAIAMDSATNCTIENNRIVFNYFGLNLERGNQENTIRGNNASANEVYGLVIWAGSDNNRVVNNVFAANGKGITLGYSAFNVITYNTVEANALGIEVQQISHNNTLVHNNVLNNEVPVGGKQLAASVNHWDDGYPSGGNYWSTYTGVDADHDGIGDTPLHMDANNTDAYPLMGRFSDFHAFAEYTVQTICTSTISNFQCDGTTIRFNVTGESGTEGACRICILTALITGPYTVVVNGIDVPYTLLPCSTTAQSYLYFTYHHSTQEVTISPQQPSNGVDPPLFTTYAIIAGVALMVLTGGVLLMRRRGPR